MNGIKLASNADLITAFGNDTSAAIQHYVNSGYSESRNTDSFDATTYLANHGDLMATFGDDTSAATQHYVNNGYIEGRSFIINSKRYFVENGFAEGRVILRYSNETCSTVQTIQHCTFLFITESKYLPCSRCR